MSRIGKQPIEVPDGVNIALDPGRVTVNGPLGELTQNVPVRISIEKEDGQLVVKAQYPNEILHCPNVLPIV